MERGWKPPTRARARDAGRAFSTNVLRNRQPGSTLQLARPPRYMPKRQSSRQRRSSTGGVFAVAARLCMVLVVVGLCLWSIWHGSHLWVRFGNRISCKQQTEVRVQNVLPVDGVRRCRQIHTKIAQKVDQLDVGLPHGLMPDLDRLDTAMEQLGTDMERGAAHVVGRLACSVKVFMHHEGQSYRPQLSVDVQHGRNLTRSAIQALNATRAVQLSVAQALRDRHKQLGEWEESFNRNKSRFLRGPAAAFGRRDVRSEEEMAREVEMEAKACRDIRALERLRSDEIVSAISWTNRILNTLVHLDDCLAELETVITTLGPHPQPSDMLRVETAFLRCVPPTYDLSYRGLKPAFWATVFGYD
ncbi:hypothetical protein HRR83_000362 [Exophiala dermatitidis]|uniref:Uncharacterized protein n=1 Tax=Exophiala dermatitidis TaxID=5970 RepID=A0AAN6F192_EXODE|nr:hypothetical protein HRR75_000327 [Exophiala dermatitidis]KAJ4527610.1 hypothetical protein HRR74_000364 [Exophiala dermatitidis]KAJ4528246.1 hypothetical protein HRR73_000868 [Exophiala dermatitidis]KAJ4531186.1 hypothetical protein HRR76_008860 [Exophiala dermatitidis]KAJ4536193.1 hypothetical protein HRR78_008632 [Exophiala dermatitidis]